MSEWIPCYRIAQSSHKLEARRADGGEQYGHENLHTAERGVWLCRNPENGHTWTMSDESFDELYCEVGKQQKPKKKKKQQDGYRKGQSKKRSASAEVDDDGSLFEE
jgi:hypothetical protein